MRKIQLFAAASIDLLQQDINQWLQSNKEANIIDTNMTSLSKVSVLGSEETTEGQYAFYILYSLNEETEHEEHTFSSFADIPHELTDPGIIENEIN